MPFPRKEELLKIMKDLENFNPALVLPEDAGAVDILKYKICEKFVLYMLENNISQAQLSRDFGVDPARLNEIVKYKIHLFTVDKLMEIAERLNPDLYVELREKGKPV